MPMTEYDKVITHYPSGSDTGTDHLGTENEDGMAVTACGQEWVPRSSGIGRARSTFVFDSDSATITNPCGNCPWDED